jgi:phage major head subunit gpT-like protein
MKSVFATLIAVFAMSAFAADAPKAVEVKPAVVAAPAASAPAAVVKKDEKKKVPAKSAVVKDEKAAVPAPAASAAKPAAK